jgi:tetratricopeptide (TPR) repeat protein
MFHRFLLPAALLIVGTAFVSSAIAFIPVNTRRDIKIAQGMNDSFLERRDRQILTAREKENQEQWAEAEKIWQTLIKDEPKNSTYQYRLGLVLARQQKFDDALAAYQKAIQIEPNYALAHNAIGETLMQQQKVDDAIAAFRKAISINENYEDPLKNLGLALREKGQNAEAVSFLERAKKVFQQRGNYGMVRQLEQLIQQMREPRTSNVRNSEFVTG